MRHINFKSVIERTVETIRIKALIAVNENTHAYNTERKFGVYDDAILKVLLAPIEELNNEWNIFRKKYDKIITTIKKLCKCEDEETRNKTIIKLQNLLNENEETNTPYEHINHITLSGISFNSNQEDLIRDFNFRYEILKNCSIYNVIIINSYSELLSLQIKSIINLLKEIKEYKQDILNNTNIDSNLFKEYLFSNTNIRDEYNTYIHNINPILKDILKDTHADKPLKDYNGLDKFIARNTAAILQMYNSNNVNAYDYFRFYNNSLSIEQKAKAIKILLENNKEIIPIFYRHVEKLTFSLLATDYVNTIERFFKFNNINNFIYYFTIAEDIEALEKEIEVLTKLLLELTKDD